MNHVPLWFFTAASLFATPLAAQQTAVPAPALRRTLQWFDAADAKHAATDPIAALAGHAATLRRIDNPRGGKVQQYRQEILGLDVYGARVTVVHDNQGQPRAVGGSFSTAAASATLPSFALNPDQALRKALDALDIAAAGATAVRKHGDDAYLYAALSADAGWRSQRPARIKPVWFAADDGLLAAYYIEIVGQRRGEPRPLAEALLVSAGDGRILRRHSQIHDLQPFIYRVFAGSDGRPYTDPFGYTNPHPTGIADAYRPALPAPMPLLSLSHAAIASGDPWLADEATQTRGNNVDAFFNAEVIADGECSGEGWGPGFDAGEGDFRATVNGPRRFDYAYDVAAAPDDYVQCFDPLAPLPAASTVLNAKIVQGFYAGNWLHDFFYDLGYDEASGNAQADNYGRGGLAGDPLLVHAGFLSTFTYAPADGESPSLSLGVNLHSLSNRDVSAFDFGVLAHEWAHTMFARLTVSAYYGQPGALNEGTADFVGLLLGVREQDRHAMAGRPEFSGAYALGAYMNLDYDYPPDGLPPAGAPGNPDNSYYHGIRRFPYSSERQRNPLNFRHISIDHPLPPASQPFDWKARSRLNAEIHTAGEVWTSALWQCARNVLAAAPPAQFDARQRDLFGWLVTALKLFPVDATYTEARTAVLLAIRSDSEADYRRCRSGFAERGLGAGAISPPRASFSLRGVQESLRDAERALGVVELRLREDSGDGDAVLDRDEQGTLIVSLRNSGFSALHDITLAVPPIPGFYALPERSHVDGIALAPEETVELEFPLRLRSRLGALSLPLQAFAWDAQHPQAFAVASRAFVVNYDLRRDRHLDTAASDAAFAADWSHGFEGNPHGCVFSACSGAQGAELADVLDWQRRRYNGSWSYLIADPHLGLNAWLATRPFTAAAAAPLELLLRHDYDFERTTLPAGYGRIEIRLDDGAWQDATPYLSGGSAAFSGTSAGWRDDVVRFNGSVAGRRVQLRLRLRVSASFAANDAHWAVARVELRGAADAMFSRVVGEP